MKKSSILWISSGFLLLLVGVVFLTTLPLVIMKIINSKLVLSPDNPSWPLWRDLPVPIVQKFYLYNVTNAREVQSSGAVPHLQQIGPFVYRLHIKKNDINLTDSGRSVTFNEHMTFHFDRDLSVDDLSRKITTLNAPLAIALQLIDNIKSPIFKGLAKFALNQLNEDFFVVKSVEELLFDGYPDLLTKLAPFLDPKIPFQPSFGWMYGKNESDDGLFKVNTGKSDISQVNEIETLNGLPELTFWSANRCNSLKGAKNGELFNPIPDTDKKLLLFRTNFCRVWALVWESAHKSTYGGLPVYRYFPADNTFANSSDYPPNSCYKPNENISFTQSLDDIDATDVTALLHRVRHVVNDSEVLEFLEETYLNYTMNGSQSVDVVKESQHVSQFREFPSGVFGLSVCYFGAPIFISNPHFLKADPYYLTTVSGLKPDSDAHQSFLDIEPQTGTPIELGLRVQINVYINSLADYFKQYRKMPKIHVPIMWQEFTIHATDSMANDLYWKLTAPTIISTTVSSLFVLIGALTLVFIASKPVIKRCKHRRTGENNSVDSHGVETSDTSALIVNHNIDGHSVGT